MPFRATFNCLWCGSAQVTDGPEDPAGWAQICQMCLGRAEENPFVQFRLREAEAERRAGRPPEIEPPPDDEWYLRRGRHAQGPIQDTGWQAELDTAGRWLDDLPIAGRIVELAAGTGWWSPLLATKGDLTAYDADGTRLDQARDRLLAHGLRAHLHVRDPLAEPEPPPATALVLAFWFGRLRAAWRPQALGRARGWLGPDGLLVVLDRLAGSGPGDPTEIGLEPAAFAERLAEADFSAIEVTTTGRHFLLARANAPA